MPWTEIYEKNILEWIEEEEWLEAVLLKDLKGIREQDPVFVETRKRVARLKPISDLIDSLRCFRICEEESSSSLEDALWKIVFLGDIGLIMDDLELPDIFWIEMLSLAENENAFSGKACFANIYLYALFNIGLMGDVRLDKLYGSIARSQKEDGAWKSQECRCARAEGETSGEIDCGYSAFTSLMAVSVHPFIRFSPVSESLASYFSDCDTGDLKRLCDDDSCDGMLYPWSSANKLMLLDGLSRLSGGRRSEKAERLVLEIREMSDEKGIPESPKSGFGQSHSSGVSASSRWLTYIAVRAAMEIMGR